MKQPSSSLGFDQSRAADAVATEKLAYQTLLMKYLELQKGFVSKKRKLQALKKKREQISAEVRFLKRRYKQLTKNQSSDADKDLHYRPNKNLQTGAIDQLMLSKSCQRDDAGEGEVGDGVYEEDLRPKKKMKKQSDGKKRVSWSDQVTVNVYWV